MKVEVEDGILWRVRAPKRQSCPSADLARSPDLALHNLSAFNGGPNCTYGRQVICDPF